MGSYLDSRVPITVLSGSTSYIARDPTLTTIYPSHERSYQSGVQVYNQILFLSQISKVSQVVPLLFLVINYPSVASYTREDEFPSHARLLPLLSN
jgi:hypothetical protein